MEQTGSLSEAPQPERHVRYAWATELASGKDVLDAGCGGGAGTARLAAAAATAVGVDSSAAAISDARRDHGARAIFEVGDLRALPFDDGQFDVVVCFETIAWVPETELVLGELRRVLRPGGMLLASSPNLGAYPAGNPLHQRELTPAELERELSARFSHVAVHHQHSYFASLLGDTDLLAHDDPTEPIGPQLAKLAGRPPDGALHSVAVASDGELPPAPAFAALGEPLDYLLQQRELASWRQRAIDAEAAELAARNELHLLRQQLAADAGDGDGDGVPGS